jgi:hypothetical protein
MFRVVLIIIIIIFLAATVYLLAGIGADNTTPDKGTTAPIKKKVFKPLVRKRTVVKAGKRTNTKTPESEKTESPPGYAIGFKIPPDAAIKRYNIPESEVDKFSSFPDLYDEVSKSKSIFTREKNGGPIILVTKVCTNSIVDRIGLKKGDKIRTVNGYRIENAAQAMLVYNALKDQESFTVEMERDGKVEFLIYDIIR